jgi:hypothetical protein
MMGFWSGLTAWILLVIHVFGGSSEFPVFAIAPNGNWYSFGFRVGTDSPLLVPFGAGDKSSQPTATSKTRQIQHVTWPLARSFEQHADIYLRARQIYVVGNNFT